MKASKLSIEFPSPVILPHVKSYLDTINPNEISKEQMQKDIYHLMYGDPDVFKNLISIEFDRVTREDEIKKQKYEELLKIDPNHYDVKNYKGYSSHKLDSKLQELISKNNFRYYEIREILKTRGY